jgi:hypothetical protein
MRVNFSKFVGPYPAVHYKLFVATVFFDEQERASAGRFSGSGKNTVSLKKAFHFHLGQSNRFVLKRQSEI